MMFFSLQNFMCFFGGQVKSDSSFWCGIVGGQLQGKVMNTFFLEDGLTMGEVLGLDV